MKNILLCALFIVVYCANASQFKAPHATQLQAPKGNFFHKAIWAGNPMRENFFYGIENLVGLDPQQVNKNGDTLWHSLMYPSPLSHPIAVLEDGARILNKYRIDPYQKNNNHKSGIDLIVQKMCFCAHRLKKYSYTQNRNGIENNLRNLRHLSHLLEIIVTTYVPDKGQNKLSDTVLLQTPQQIINLPKPIIIPKIPKIMSIADKTAIENSIKSILSNKNRHKELRIASWYRLMSLCGKITEMRWSKKGIKEERSFSADAVEDYIIDPEKEFPITIVLLNKEMKTEKPD